MAVTLMTKREFLQTLGSLPPALRLLAGAPPAALAAATQSQKFTPVDASRFLTLSIEKLKALMKEPVESAKELSGRQSFRGIPFDLPGYTVLSTRAATGLTGRLQIPIHGKATFICLAQFCDADENETPPPHVDRIEKVGQALADLVLVFEDGTEHRHPIRRRFEVGAKSPVWGHLCFAAVPHRQDVPSTLADPLGNAHDWGDLQIGVWDSNYAGQIVWISAVPNPYPDRALTALRFESRHEDPLALCGVTLFHGRENPLRYERLSLYRLTLPEPSEPKRWDVSVDLGVIARQYQLPVFDAEPWLASPRAGLGDTPDLGDGARFLYLEISASPEATLTLRDRQTDRHYEFEIGQAREGRDVAARNSGPRIEFLERDKVWLHAKVVDASTGRPTPVRIAFLSKDGRYLPPYGHRAEINTGWFQDYGADLKQGRSSYAYVDGAFQIELPVGEVYVEITKGFEYQRVRQKLTIHPDQRELPLEIGRFADLRSKGWVSADSHVHFLSPTTAILEGQAEGLNLINLLAAQWGDLFTNVGDLGHRPLVSPDGETMIRVGTENRNHILGHLGLLGGNGSPVFPMSTAGPGESYIGDPVWNSMTDWADRCRERGDLVMAVHFPYPTGEIAAEVILGKIDAVELRTDAAEAFNGLRILDWYHYLNCGYRLPAFGGTDKMNASMVVGGNRGYAWLGDNEFTFANWAKAVRAGNTFMTTGPLLFFEAEDRRPGAEIRMNTGGGTVEVRAEARSTIPVHSLEIVWNGTVVASRDDRAGTREMLLQEKIRVPGPGWIAARCRSLVHYAEHRIAAHTSPVYVVVPGEDLFSGPAAAYMLTLLDGAETWTRNLATRPSPEAMASVLDVFTTARERLHQRMHAHGIPH